MIRYRTGTSFIYRVLYHAYRWMSTTFLKEFAYRRRRINLFLSLFQAALSRLTLPRAHFGSCFNKTLYDTYKYWVFVRPKTLQAILSCYKRYGSEPWIATPKLPTPFRHSRNQNLTGITFYPQLSPTPL